MSNSRFIQLHEVHETAEAGVYRALITADIDGNGANEQIEFGVVPGDLHGIGPAVAAAVAVWTAEGNPVAPYVPPSAEVVRASMPALTARQLRLGLIGAGKSLTEVDTAIAAIKDPAERQAVEIEWQYATAFQRLHPLVVSLAGALGFTCEDLDALWTSALEL